MKPWKERCRRSSGSGLAKLERMSGLDHSQSKQEFPIASLLEEHLNTTIIENFFVGKTFVIPSYEVDSAWGERKVDVLLADMEEAVAGDRGHHLGMFILSQPDKDSRMHYVIDGKQRLVALTLLLDALISALLDAEARTLYRNVYIRHPISGLKLHALAGGQRFFLALRQGQPVGPTSDGQERSLAAYRRMRQRVDEIVQSGGQELVARWLWYVSGTTVRQSINELT